MNVRSYFKGYFLGENRIKRIDEKDNGDIDIILCGFCRFDKNSLKRFKRDFGMREEPTVVFDGKEFKLVLPQLTKEIKI